MLNKVILMGRLTRDPELRTTASDISVCTFTVAVDRRYQKSGENRQTDFINVVAWRTTAEFVNRYFSKGRMINVVGSLQTRTWDDAEGKRHYVTEVVAEEINFCGDKKPESSNDNSFEDNQDFESKGFEPFETSDDLPF
jgi:single-strand DNA-binding protein